MFDKKLDVTMSKGELIFIGIGLYNDRDISLRGLDLAKSCDMIYAEFYTSKLAEGSIQRLEKLIGKKIKILDRNKVEEGNLILDVSETKKVGFLTAGDPMSATTHVDLRLRAVEKGIKTIVVHGSSIFTAVPGLLGLQHYKFGRSTTLVSPEGSYFPMSPYNVIAENKKRGLHTLVLLDINSERGRYMTIREGLDLLMDMERRAGYGVIDENTLVCGVARAGSEDCILRAGPLKLLKYVDFGPPLHTIVIPGSLHFMEEEALRKFASLNIKR